MKRPLDTCRYGAFGAGYTGLRFGEVTGLTVDNLNLLHRQLRVVNQLTEVKGELTLSPILKTKSSRRTIKLPAFLVDELAFHIKRFPSASVFSSAEGRPPRRSNFYRRVWRPPAPHGVRFHDHRHSHAAMLIANGQHPKVIQERLGHTSIKTTLDVYGHLYDGLDEAAADALDDVWQRSRVDKMWTGTGGAAS
ncbi:MAG: site-specific integrase [Acidimicrobiia bacterium]